VPAKKWELDGAARALEDAHETVHDELCGIDFQDPDSYALRMELDEIAGKLKSKAEELRARAKKAET